MYKLKYIDCTNGTMYAMLKFCCKKVGNKGHDY